MKLSKLLPLFLLLFVLIFSSCKKDELLTDSSAKLEFSTDSVLFDTVFHYAGSTTKVFRIYNPHSQPINISKAYLAGGSGSAFKLNIDGTPTTASNPVLHDIEILGGDSMYVFVQVYVNPSGSMPVLIKDSIIFETNGNIQDVKLTAIGQDVYLHKPIAGKFYSIMSSWSFASPDTTLPVDKPHLVFGYVVVDSAHRVIIPAGAKFYMHNHAVLWVYRDGTLEVQGSKGNEVTFQGDRLEPEYKEVPGQWGKIWFSQLSKNNIVNYAIIKNGGIGVQCDTVANATPTLRISNTIIKNMSAAAMFGQGAHIRAVNCLFYNCGQYLAALTIGGNYSFKHCTFDGIWSGDEARTTPLLVMTNYYISTGSALVIRSLDSCYFGNCILHGDLGEEIGIDSTTAVGYGYFNYKFDHCIIRTARSTSDPHYVVPYPNVDPGFANVSDQNFRPYAGSSNIIDKGDASITGSIATDLDNTARIVGPFPDLGAYEY